MAKEEIVNIPNSITLFRLLLVIPLVYFLFHNNTTAGLIIYITIVLLDGVDGFVARAFNQKTKFGDHFDGISDATVVITALLVMCYLKFIPVLVLIAVLIGRILTLAAMGYFYVRNIRYKLIYVKTGMFMLYVLIAYILLIPDYNWSIILILLLYTYIVIIVSYTRILLDYVKRKN
jgi:cardiolipin synthase (CMP-forming)